MNQSPRPLIVVDDDSIVFMMINRIVKKRQIDVEIKEIQCANALLNNLRNKTNDTSSGIILLDINMPNMDGWTFIEQLINLHINCPHKIYIHSSSDSLMDVNRAKSYEGIVNGYIAKNISPETLLMLLEAYESNTFDANQFLYLKEGW